MGSKMKSLLYEKANKIASSSSSPAYITLKEALVQWNKPDDPCASSQRIIQNLNTHQVFPAPSFEDGEQLLSLVEQATALKSPGITSLTEVLIEYISAFEPQDDGNEDQETAQQEHPHSPPNGQRADCLVKAYILLCVYPTNTILEKREKKNTTGGGFDCTVYVHKLTDLFHILLEYCRKDMRKQARVVGTHQLHVVVDNTANTKSQKQCYSLSHRCTVLKDLNELLSNFKVEVRTALRQQCSGLFKQLPRIIKETGDYDTQTSLVELIYRLTSSDERNRSVSHWFRELDLPSQYLFLSIIEFDPHCRRFLNAYNSSLGKSRKVFTFPCQTVYIGKLKLYKPQCASYPSFWIDFNLDTSSILVLCQVNADAKPDDSWENLTINCEEVKQVKLIRQKHSYNLEVQYDDACRIEKLFTSPLKEDNNLLLSNLIYFEFFPHKLLEEVCRRLYGQKLIVNNLEPQEWQGITDSTKGFSSNSSSCPSARKFSTVFTHIDTDPPEPQIAQESNYMEHLVTSQPSQSSTSSFKKHRKSSSVSMVFNMGTEDMAEQNGRESGKPTASSLGNKRSKTSAVYMKFTPSELPEMSEREPSEEGNTSGKHMSSSSSRVWRSAKHGGRGKRKKVRSNRPKQVHSTSSHHLPSTLGCYLPLSFTSPRPGAPIPNTRATSPHTKTGSSGYIETEQVQPKRKPAGYSSPSTKGKESLAAESLPNENGELKEVNSEIVVVFPSSDESLKMNQEAQKSKKDANNELDVVYPSSEESNKMDQEALKYKNNVTKSDAHSMDENVEIHTVVNTTSKKSAVNQEPTTPPQTVPVAEKEFSKQKMKSSKGLMTNDKKEQSRGHIPQKPNSPGCRETRYSSGKSDNSKSGKATYEVNYPKSKKSLETEYSLPEKALSPDQSHIVPIQQQCDKVPSLRPLHKLSEPTPEPYDNHKTSKDSSHSKSSRRDFQETLPSHRKRVENSVRHTHSQSEQTAPKSPLPQSSQDHASLKGTPDSAENAERLMKDKDQGLRTGIEEDSHASEMWNDIRKEMALHKEGLCVKETSGSLEENKVQEKESAEEMELLTQQKKVLASQENISLIEAEGEILSQEEIIESVKGVLGSKKALESQGEERTLEEDKLQILETSPHHKLKVPLHNGDSHCSYQKSYATEENAEEIEMQEELVRVRNSGEAEIQDEAKTPIKTSEPLHPDQEYDTINHAKNEPSIKQTPQERQQASSTEILTKGSQRKRGRSYLAATPHSNEDMHKKNKHYAILNKSGATPLSQKSSGKIRNKRKLFDPTAQEHVEIKTPSEGETSNPSRNQSKQSENSDEGSKSNQFNQLSNDSSGKTTTPYDEMHKAKPVKKITGKQYFFSKRDRSANTSRSNRKSRSNSKLSKKATNSPKKASSFMEDTFLNDKAHTVFSDLDSSPDMGVDSWFTERIARYNGVSHHDTSSKKKSVEKERKIQGKDKELGKENVYDNVSSNSLSDMSPPKSNKRKATEEVAKLKDTNIYNDTEITECNDSLATCHKRRKSLRRKKPSFFASFHGSSTSDISLTSSHDEWIPPSTDKKKNSPLKENKEFLVLKKSKERHSQLRKGSRLIGKSSKDSSELQVDNTSSLTEQDGVSGNNSELLESIDTLRHTSKNSVDACEAEYIDFNLTASKSKTNSIRGIHLTPTEPRKLSAGPKPVPPISSPVPKASEGSVVRFPNQQTFQPVSVEPQPSSLILSTSPQSPSQSPKDPNDKSPNFTSESSADTSKTEKHSTFNEIIQVVSQATQSPALTQSFEVHPMPQQGLEAIDISAILNPEINAHTSVSGPFQSTLLENSEKNKVSNNGHRFSYIPEAVSSPITNQEEREEELNADGDVERDSPVADPVTVELRYDKDPVASLTPGSPHMTLEETTPPCQPTVTVSKAESNSRENYITVSSHSTTVATVRKQLPSSTTTNTTSVTAHAYAQLPAANAVSNSTSSGISVPSVTPTAKVPPQSVVGSSGRGRNGANLISRLYRQPGPDMNVTPPSSRGQSVSPGVPHARDLFGAAGKQHEPQQARESRFGSISMDMCALLTDFSTDLQHFSISACRLSHSFSTLVNKIRDEHHEEGNSSV